MESLRQSEFWVMREEDISRTLGTEKKKWLCHEAGTHKHLRLDEPWECGECGKRRFPELKDWLIANYGDCIRRESFFAIPGFDLKGPYTVQWADFLRENRELEQKYNEEKSRFLSSPPTGAIVIQCERCGISFRPGVDAVSMTANELEAMMPALIGSIANRLMIGRSVSLNRAELQRERQTILRNGPKGWICKECHKDNHWRPLPIN